MTDHPDVSIIVPVYNTANFLGKCLDSLVNQTFENIEILVVNDGSKDGSQKVLDDYVKKDARIKSFEKENGGLSDARNYVIRSAKGKYISFVDSDDWVEPTMIEEMYGLGTKHGADIVFCDLEKVNEKGEVFRVLPQSPQLPQVIDLEEDFSIFGEMSCFACNKIFKSELFENHLFLKGVHFEDIELIPKLFLESRKVARINKPFYKYFERQGSITKTHSIKGLDMFAAIENVSDSFDKSRYRDRLEELRRFQILQGFYSYLAYLAFVKEPKEKEKMIEKLNDFSVKWRWSKREILAYRRFGSFYLFQLPFKKSLYYLLAIINFRLLKWVLIP